MKKKHEWLRQTDGEREVFWCRKTGCLKVRVWNHDTDKWFGKIFKPECYKNNGAVAQLGERLVRNQQASGSIPDSSTK